MTCFAKKCQWHDMCKIPYDIGGCSHYREKRPQTNEEYLKSCNTEQLAEWIFNILLICSRCGDESQSDEEKIKKCPFGKIGCTKKDWIEWLKENHNVESSM